jgi:5-methylcytosine-specific restriction endonuclease McrA
VGRHTREDIESLVRSQRGLCACGCARSLYAGYHIDHIVPVSKGGSNWGPLTGPARGVAGNLQLLAPRCNLRKSDKLE